MGEIKISDPVKLICGLLAADPVWLSRAREALAGRFGPIDLESEIIPFDFTSYYEKELGPEILRRYVSFGELISPEDLSAIKLTTNRMEEDLSESGVRRVNLDPGYVDLSKMVLATTKDATYRVYLFDGIFAQSTYYFQGGTYHPWEWTYADYRTDAAISFFNRVRSDYKKQART
ncbi:MAG: DUF4416 family protein [Candidatus Euphemobacter frigidus]|nr:DUF4416 family protein [Candidatus Euphemobacter frigidus]MDP8276298.1 DUF4416 family protein [Candidatus Euphemobacter frigidus]